MRWAVRRCGGTDFCCANGCGACAVGFIEGFTEFDAPGVTGRGEAEDDTSEQRGECGEAEDVEVYGDAFTARKGCSGQMHEARHCGPGEKQAESRACDSDECAFREELADDVGFSRA